MWTNISPILSLHHYKINQNWTVFSPIYFITGDDIMEQKIKQDSVISIGRNIRQIRKEKGMGQTEVVRKLQLLGVEMTRETLVKIERGIQHIQAQQLRAIRDVLETSYDELLKETIEEE